jgi:hypothetical protein
MVIAFGLFVRGVVLIVQDHSRPDVTKSGNSIGFIIVSLLACASSFEGLRGIDSCISSSTTVEGVEPFGTSIEWAKGPRNNKHAVCGQTIPCKIATFLA